MISVRDVERRECSFPMNAGVFEISRRESVLCAIHKRAMKKRRCVVAPSDWMRLDCPTMTSVLPR